MPGPAARGRPARSGP